MKRIFIPSGVILITFFSGIWIQGLFQFPVSFTNLSDSEIAEAKSVENTSKFDLPDEKPSTKSERKEFSYPDPIYRFPQTGIYSSTRKNENENSEFQFEFRYEKDYQTRKVRGAKRDYEVVITDGFVFDQKSEFKKVSIKIDKDKISLKTSKVKGVEYRFEGTFTKEEFFESDYHDQIVLKGILQKYANGKKVSEETTEFTYGVGC